METSNERLRPKIRERREALERMTEKDQEEAKGKIEEMTQLLPGYILLIPEWLDHTITREAFKAGIPAADFLYCFGEVTEESKEDDLTQSSVISEAVKTMPVSPPRDQTQDGRLEVIESPEGRFHIRKLENQGAELPALKKRKTVDVATTTTQVKGEARESSTSYVYKASLEEGDESDGPDLGGLLILDGKKPRRGTKGKGVAIIKGKPNKTTESREGRGHGRLDRLRGSPVSALGVAENEDGFYDEL